MAFKIPKPTYDPVLVERIEQYLDQDYQTEIVKVYEVLDDDYDEPIMTRLVAQGRNRAVLCGYYPRPMFEPLPAEYTGRLNHHPDPCPNCDDWSRTARCPDHPDIHPPSQDPDWDIPGLAVDPAGGFMMPAELLHGAATAQPLPANRRTANTPDATESPESEIHDYYRRA